MRTFKDNRGRDWPVTVTVSTVKRVRDLAKVDLLDDAAGKGKDAAESSVFARLASDAILLADVLWAVVQPRALELNVAQADFEDALAGDAIDAATTALLEELTDFYPPQRRRALKLVLGKIKAAEVGMMAAVEKQVSELEVDLTADFQAALKRIGARSGSTPESSG